MVEVKGAVFRPGMYQVGGDINSVKTLIEHADGLREEAFTARAVMHRMKKDRTLEVVPVDVEGIFLTYLYKTTTCCSSRLNRR